MRQVAVTHRPIGFLLRLSQWIWHHFHRCISFWQNCDSLCVSSWVAWNSKYKYPHMGNCDFFFQTRSILFPSNTHPHVPAKYSRTRFDIYMVHFGQCQRSHTSSWQATDQMWQRFRLLSLTSIILHPVCQLHLCQAVMAVVGGRKKKILLDSGLEPVWTRAHESTWHQTCTSAVWRLEARVPELRRPLPGWEMWKLALRPRPLCTAMEELWLSQFATSPVTQAELQKGANGCCYGPLPQHLLWGDTLLSVPPPPVWLQRQECHAISDSTHLMAASFKSQANEW